MVNYLEGPFYEVSDNDTARSHELLEQSVNGQLSAEAELILSSWREEHLRMLMQDQVPNRIIPQLENIKARWHPSGFMVFLLGRHRKLGFVRLHMWPEELRQRQERGCSQKLGEIYDGDVHSHAWSVTGFNITGYRDDLYTTTHEGWNLSDEEVMQRGLFRIFQATYVPGSEDELVPNGRCVSIQLQEKRELLPAEIHHVQLGEYHAPTIPDNQLAATLAINSYRKQLEGPDILIRGTHQSIIAVRQEVTYEEKLLAKEQLLQVL